MPASLAHIVQTLRETEPYAVLDEPRREALAVQCRLVCLEPNEILVHDGDLLLGAFILAEGRLARMLVTPDGKSFLLNHTRPVTAFGGAALFDGSPHVGVVKAAVASTVIAVPGGVIKAYLEECPAFSLAMVRKLARSSVRQTEALLDMMFPVSVRLARLLCRQVDSTGSVELGMSKATMAELLGTVPETLSRSLATLRREGLIESEGRVIRVCDAAALRAYAQL